MIDADRHPRSTEQMEEMSVPSGWLCLPCQVMFATLTIVLNSLFRNITLAGLLIVSAGVVLQVSAFKISLIILMSYLTLIALASIFGSD